MPHRSLLNIGLALLVLLTILSTPSRAGTVFGTDKAWFTLNGQQTFMLGFSYYGALGAPSEFLRRDLDDMKRFGFNWLRVWATWGAYDNVVSAVDAQGRPREPFMSQLEWLVKECDARGMVVDVTLSRHETEDPERAKGLVPNAQAHRRAVESIVQRLKPYRNWYLDLANEHDVGDARRVRAEELRTLRARVRELDPQRLVTVSFGGHDLSRENAREVLEVVGVDFLAPHRPRHPGSPKETRAKTRELRDMAESMGHVVPVMHQEPFRRGYTDWQPTRMDFLTDVTGAREGGAGGWCFHNGGQRGVEDEQPRRSFDLRERRLLDQLDAEELEFLKRVGRDVQVTRKPKPTP